MKDTTIAQIKILRVFRLIDSMIEKPLTMKQIGKAQGTGERTANRYVHLLKDLGFEVIEENTFKGKVYSIGSKRPKFMDFLKNVA